MELLIPGLILVALMVYASTRIKKIAASAFDQETIETEDFIIQKPEGFLHNLNGDPKYIFEAYSKEYSKANDKLRVGTATLQRIENATPDQVVSAISGTFDLVNDGSEKIDGTYYHRMRYYGDETEIWYKRAAKNGDVYKLEVTAMKEASGQQWIEIFLDSFRVK